MSKIDGWKDYGIALLPTTPPHEIPNLKQLEQCKNLWKSGRFLVRYTSDFDCGRETEWWWLIKDGHMDLTDLKKKRRYEITSGLNNFDVKKISPKQYAKQLYLVYRAAFESYENVGQLPSEDKFIAQFVRHDGITQIEYYGAFHKESGELAAFSWNNVYTDYVELESVKIDPRFLPQKVSAALIYCMLVDYLNVQNKKYVNDGEKSIRHITGFQDYLIKYFGFRRAYCNLNIQYRPIVAVAVSVLFPLRRAVKLFSKFSFLHNVVSLLEMEAIRRSCKKY